MATKHDKLFNEVRPAHAELHIEPLQQTVDLTSFLCDGTPPNREKCERFIERLSDVLNDIDRRQ